MKYVATSGPGAAEVMHVATGPLPMIGDSDVLIKVEYAGVNRPDVAQRTGTYARFSTERPTFAEDDLLSQLRENGVRVEAKPLFENPSLLQTILVNFGPTLLLVGLFIFGSRYLAKRAGGMGGIGGLAPARTKRWC